MRLVIIDPSRHRSSPSGASSGIRLQLRSLVGKVARKKGVFRRKRIVEPAEHIIFVYDLVAVGGGLTLGAADQLVRHRKNLQHIGDGPCTDSIRRGDLASAWNIASRHRCDFVFLEELADTF